MVAYFERALGMSVLRIAIVSTIAGILATAPSAQSEEVPAVPQTQMGAAVLVMGQIVFVNWLNAKI